MKKLTKPLIVLSLLALHTPVYAGHGFKSERTNRFLSMELARKPVTCNRKKKGQWEQFTAVYGPIVDNQQHYYFKSVQNKKYLRRSGNENKITCSHSYNKKDKRMQWMLTNYTGESGRGIINRSCSNGIKQRGRGTNDFVTTTSALRDDEVSKRFSSSFF